MIRNFKPNRNQPIAGLDSLRTVDQNRKTWEYLKRYQSSSFVEKKLKRENTNNTNLIKKKAAQIASLMVQCEKYYESAGNSSLEIKPLVLYYGMVGLSKALILSGDNKYTLSALDPDNIDHSTHGLTVSPRNNLDKTIRDSNHLVKEFCYVATTPKKAGLYNLLRKCYSDTVLPNKFRLNIQTLLSLLPEIYKEYLSYFKQKPNCWECDAHFGISDTNDTIQLIEFRDYCYITQKTKNEKYSNCIKRCYPELTTLYNKEPNGEDRFRLKTNARSIDDYIFVSQLLTLETYALKRLNGYCLCDLDVHFMLMHILSNLVRYRQDKWSRLIRRLDNDEIFLIESFIEISFLKYPYLILRELDNIDYVFIGQVGTWG